ncbi:MAG: N-methyl-L-tryptophan oxidase [Candidatus Rokubacteria bacterium]|nr:N-methyl-L-tryptophan oxidase [Candidatus Rokubacteria bacterium]
MDASFDAVVLGLGAMGSAAAYQLARRGVRVLGIDQFSPPHVYGSTHGDTRITRQAIGEGEEYTPLSLRSYELWREIERETGKELLTVTGGLIISSPTKLSHHHVSNFFERTVAVAAKYGIPHTLLDAPQIRRRFPQFSVRDAEVGYYEPDAGFLRPEECVRAQLALAEKSGARLALGERATGFSADRGRGVTVRTDRGEYAAASLVLSAGPWLPRLLGPEGEQVFTVSRQVMYWFDVNGTVAPFLPERFPVFIWEVPDRPQVIYGFPAVDGPGGGVKVASEQYETSTTPDTVSREVTGAEVRAMYETYVAPYLRGLGNRCIKAMACLYTVTPDFGFVIDAHPNYPQVIIASPCSGHGFKHSAALGEVLAQLVVDGKSTIDVSRFTLRRFVN